MDSILRWEIKKPIATTYVVFFCLVSPLKWASEALMDSLSRWEINRSMVLLCLVSPHKNIYNQLSSCKSSRAFGSRNKAVMESRL
jgi:hypothetical protein